MISMEANIRPPFTISSAGDILKAQYSLQAQTITELSAELDRNFQVTTAAGRSYVLKIAHHSLSGAVLDLQNTALRHLAPLVDFCPQLVSTPTGEMMVKVPGQDQQMYHARLLTYLEGVPLAAFRPHSSALLYQIGSQLGRLSSAMQSFQHNEQRLHYRWNLRSLPEIISLADGMSQERRSLLAYFVGIYEREVLPRLDTIRHSFIYNDANEHNILIHSKALEGVPTVSFIDFGDMVYGPTIAELAVALAYILLHKRQPLAAAVPVIQGFHAEYPLGEEEIALLYPLIAARLCLSVCISWYQQRREPDNGYLSASESGAWQLLEDLHNIHPDFAHYTFRSACGWPPCPQSAAIQQWIEEHPAHPLLGQPFDEANTRILDLSAGSVELGSVDEFADTALFTQRLFSSLLPGQAGIGRYDEARPIYLGDHYAITHHERRTIHIGVDVFVPAGTPIYAPYAGTVFSVKDNGRVKDYGPTLILEHRPQAGIRFYTLYGHLGASVLGRWQAGQAVQQGELIAEAGQYPENGDWPPHLHFQIIANRLGNSGDFPGVVSPRERSVWLSISPDPNLALRIAGGVRAGQASNQDELVAARRAMLNPAMSISYRRPLKIVRGYMRHLYDENGQVYLDCVNNVPHVGHANPRVVRAAQRQMAVLNTNTRYLHDTIVKFAEQLRATLPPQLEVCYLVNSGTEANELAVRLARTATGGSDFIVVEHAYHGNTSTLIDLSPYKFNSRGGKGRPEHVQAVMMPDGYRGPRRGFDEQSGRWYAGAVQEALEAIEKRGASIAAFLSESIISGGGHLMMPKGYLSAAYEGVRGAGGVCIADEVQIGFGRVGTHFWGFQTQGVVPDIVSMGKPIGNGHPLAAVVTTRAVAEAFHNGMEFFSTFGGNPVSCAVGLEVLRIIQDERLQQNALEVGSHFMERLRTLQADFPLIGHVRGSGLFIGVELVRDTSTLEPATEETAYIIEQMKDNGILVSSEGPYHNVLKIKPPLIFRREDADLFVTTLAAILSHTALLPDHKHL